MATKTSNFSIISFGVGQIPVSIKGHLFGSAIVFYYNVILGLEAWWASLALAISLVIDGITDPTLGYLSDYTRSRWGRRHPYIFLSLIPSVLFYFLLLTSEKSDSQMALFLQLLALTVGLRIAWTFYEVPRQALGAEITKDYDQRTQLHGFNSFFGWIAGAFVAVVFAGMLGDSYQNASAYHDLAMMGSLTIAIASLYFAVVTSRHIPELETPRQQMPKSFRENFKEIFSTLNHRSWLSLFWAGVVFNLLIGLTVGLEFYWNEYFWEWKPSDVQFFPLVAALGAIVISAFAGSLAKRFDKKQLAVKLFFVAIVIGPLLLVFRLIDIHFGIQIIPPNGEIYGPLWWVMLVHHFFAAAIPVLAFILVGSMNADVVEDSMTQTGRRSEGLFFAGPHLIQKAMSGLGVMTKGVLLLAVGFTASSPEIAKVEAIVDLAFLVAIIQIILPFICLYLLSRYEITRDQHEDNLSELGYNRD